MLARTRTGSFRAVLLIVLGILMGSTLLAPAVAHVSSSLAHIFSHTDTRYYKKALSDARFINVGENATSATTANTATSAGNSNLLDGMDSSDFAPADAEAWRAIGAVGQPAFITQTCFDPNPFNYFAATWANYDGGSHNTAAFYKDPSGRVHLRGLVKDGWTFEFGSDIGSVQCGKIFQLPPGYRPSSREVLVTLTYHGSAPGVRVARINIDPDGTVWAGENSNRAWLSLDGVSFRPTS